MLRKVSQHLLLRLSGLDLPKAQGFIPGAGDNATAVGTKGHGVHRVGMAFERIPDGLASGGIPKAQGAVARAGDDVLAVGTKGHGTHPAGMAFERIPDGLASGGIPKAQGFVD